MDSRTNLIHFFSFNSFLIHILKSPFPLFFQTFTKSYPKCYQKAFVSLKSGFLPKLFVLEWSAVLIAGSEAI